MSAVLVTVGLGLDIVGVVMLSRYGLPPSDARRGGGITLLVGHDRRAEERAYLYEWRSRWALRLIVLGFVIQIIGAWWPPISN